MSAAAELSVPTTIFWIMPSPPSWSPVVPANGTTVRPGPDRSHPAATSPGGDTPNGGRGGTTSRTAESGPARRGAMPSDHAVPFLRAAHRRRYRPVRERRAGGVLRRLHGGAVRGRAGPGPDRDAGHGHGLRRASGRAPEGRRAGRGAAGARHRGGRGPGRG